MNRADIHEVAEAAVMEAASHDDSLSRDDCQRIYEEAAEALELAEQEGAVSETARCIDCGMPVKDGGRLCLRCWAINKL
jgi:hypothetical protein